MMAMKRVVVYSIQEAEHGSTSPSHGAVLVSEPAKSSLFLSENSLALHTDSNALSGSWW